jgi:hypothetical protein
MHQFLYEYSFLGRSFTKKNRIDAQAVGGDDSSSGEKFDARRASCSSFAESVTDELIERAHILGKEMLNSNLLVVERNRKRNLFSAPATGCPSSNCSVVHVT